MVDKNRGKAPVFMEPGTTKNAGAVLTYPAAARNMAPIGDALAEIMPDTGKILELASGTGQHVCAFARKFPCLEWHPSDVSQKARASIDARAALEADLSNIAPARALDLENPGWWRALPGGFAGLMAINLIHIAPWPVSENLVAGAARLIEPSGFVFLYGPFSRGGVHSAPSNARFDESLKAQDPTWGVRDLDDIARLGRAHDFDMGGVVTMPKNNLSIVLCRK